MGNVPDVLRKKAAKGYGNLWPVLKEKPWNSDLDVKMAVPRLKIKHFYTICIDYSIIWPGPTLIITVEPGNQGFKTLRLLQIQSLWFVSLWEKPQVTGRIVTPWNGRVLIPGSSKTNH